MSAMTRTPETIRLPSSFWKLGETDRPLSVRTRMFGRAWPIRAPVRDGIIPTWPQLLNSLSVPCTDDEVATKWVNDPAVRKTIHAETITRILLPGDIEHSYTVGIMICVPFTGTEAWTRSVGYEIVDEWRPWTSNGQVAGYLQGYDHNLTFLTIKGAGHTVPEYKPQEALDFYTRFLAGKPI
ncbi:Serine carboxypeptidase 1 [Hibiscus syriacus]|uniref:Serine carboxypeptidase 1 n=1 Tax=Hibiscus syriacus TaxID=106335 RepID=A0A6A2WS49_HIBSY|nr:Serine carboxypeptidase 1 [Hibiscus syriacus]